MNMESQMGMVSMERMLIAKSMMNHTPITAQLELLPLCNLNCDMCYVRLSQKEMQAQGRLRTADEWIDLARQMAKAGTLFAMLTGGEVLLFPDFKKLYLELKRLGMIITFTTNGSLIDEDWAAFFGQHKPRRINVTLYGASDETYASLCHAPGGFERAVRGIRLLKEAGVDVRVNHSVARANSGDMEAVCRIGGALGAPVQMDTYMAAISRERPRPFDQHSRLPAKEAAAANIRALRLEMKPEAFADYVRRTVQAVQEGGRYTDRVNCQAGNSAFAITWNGMMRPCLSYAQPSVPVFEMGFDAAWQEIVRRTGEIRLSPVCAACALRPLCKTCAATAWWETGAFDGVPQYLCQYSQEYYRLLQNELEKLG